MRATAVVALLLHALPGAYGVAATTFVRVPEDLAYAEAEARCTQIGAAIASIHSVAENELARIACGNTCWLGLAETGGDAGTAAANQTWLWQDPLSPAAYTNWAAGEPENAGGVDQRNAIIDTAGEWHDCGDGSLGLGYVAYPLCRVAGELDFTLDHAPQQCQVNTCIKGKTGNVPRKDRDPTCCGRGATTSNIKHRSCAPVRNQTYQLVQTGEACDVGEYAYAYKKYKCYPCKPGKTCDVGPGDEERCKWSSGTFVGIFSRLPRSDHLLHLCWRRLVRPQEEERGRNVRRRRAPRPLPPRDQGPRGRARGQRGQRRRRAGRAHRADRARHRRRGRTAPRRAKASKRGVSF
jgi:hypothetical protein